MNRFYKPDFIPSSVAGNLEAYDLPDLAANLAPRRLFIAGLVDGAGHPADANDIAQDTAVIKTAYRRKHAGGQLKFLSRRSIEDSRSPSRASPEWAG
jgi:hypothetical protein